MRIRHNAIELGSHIYLYICNPFVKRLDPIVKLSYYTYLLRKHSTGERYLFDLRPFLSAFVGQKNVDFKTDFPMQADTFTWLERIVLCIFLLPKD